MAEHLAGVASVLEDHVARARAAAASASRERRRRARAAALHRRAARPGGPPERRDLLQGRALFVEHLRDRAGLAQRHQVEAQPVVGLVALGDQAAPVGEDGAQTAEAGAHRGRPDGQPGTGLTGMAPHPCAADGATG